jgi:hypothetical protein
MKFKIVTIFIALIFFIAQPVNISKADLASDLLKIAGEASEKNKKELAKWGLKSSKDIKKLKSKEIKLLFNGNVLEGILNDNQNKGKTEEVYYKDGTYKGIVLGKKETAEWYVKEGKLCYKSGFTGCSKVYKSKSEPVVYFLKVQGIIFTKFTKVTSIEEVEKIKKAAKEKKLAEEKAAKEKKLAEEKAAKEKKLAEEKAAKEKKLAEEKIANEKLEKKLLLLPGQTDLEKAQNFLNSIKGFVKLFPDEFDIIKISEFLISTKPISDGNLDAELKDNLEIFKEFANSSSEFVKYYKNLEIMRKDKDLAKIDKTILSFEKNINTIKVFLVNNSDSIYAEQWLDDLKKAKKILSNPTSHDELLIENDRLSNVVLNAQKIDKAKIDAKLTIVELEENLKLNLTSDLAPLIIEQVKSLEQALKKENIEDITSADKIAKEFIFKQFEEPKLKAAEEKRIVDEKAAEEKRIAEEERLKNFKKIKLTCIYDAGRGYMDYSMKWMFDGKTVFLEMNASVDGDKLTSNKDMEPLKFGKTVHPAGEHVWVKFLSKLGGVDRFSFITETPQVKNEFIINFNEKKSRLDVTSFRDGHTMSIKGDCS